MRDFVEARYTDLLRTAYLLTGSSHEAEDLVPSALLRMTGRWERIDDPLAYARRTIMNLYLNSLRRRRRELVTALLPERAVREGTTGSSIAAPSGRHCGPCPRGPAP